MGHKFLPCLFLIAVLLLNAGCSQQPVVNMYQKDLPRVPVKTSAQPLNTPNDCTGSFSVKKLPVTNGIMIREIRTYLSNGSGVAINDLNEDGLLDLVFGSIDRESTILWNEGDFTFRAEPLEARFVRGVNLVDVNGDGHIDIVFTHRGIELPSYWQNQGPNASGPRFVRSSLDGVTHYAYSMAWADLDNNGTLDLVTGAYDADLKNHGLNPENIRENGGVTVYLQQDGRFTAEQLDDRAETLAIALVDLNQDGKLDIWAANDFALPDAFWIQEDRQWSRSQPFRETSYSTMSIDWGDLDNNGQASFYTTDMNPGETSTSVLASWLPVLSALEEKHGPNDPQIMANVLQSSDGRGGWRNEAAQRAVDATGWSWSGKFGDLNNDGFLDLYVVNGMIATDLFAHLPFEELVEQNRSFRNLGSGNFAPAPEWNLGSQASGRGMMMADLNNDGLLDIVVNNLRGQAELFVNGLCQGQALEIDLDWAQSSNRKAIGAVIQLFTDRGTLLRDVRANSGYQSGDPSRVHFGFPDGTILHRLVITYPDGAAAIIDSPDAQTRLKVTR